MVLLRIPIISILELWKFTPLAKFFSANEEALVKFAICWPKHEGLNNELRVQEAAREGPTALHIRFCSLSNNSKKHLGALAQTWQKDFAKLNVRFIETQSKLRRKKLDRTNLGSNFLGGSFSNRDNVRDPMQFRRDSQRQQLKRLIFLKNRPIHFHINSASVFRPVKWKQFSFSSIEIIKPFLPQSTESCRSDSSLRANYSCCHRSDAWSHLESNIISIDSKITDNIIRKIINI